jgi:hypothetical protein
LINKNNDYGNNKDNEGVFTDTNNDGQKMLNKYGSELVNIRLIKSNISIMYIVNLICDAQEFSELPVRHNLSNDLCVYLLEMVAGRLEFDQ